MSASSFWLGSSEGGYDADAHYADGCVWLGSPKNVFVFSLESNECDADARYDDGRIWLGSSEGSSCDADARYTDGCIWLGSSEGSPADADAHYANGCVWLGSEGFFEGIAGGSNECDADARYDGDDDGAAAAAVLLLLSGGSASSGSYSSDEEESYSSGSYEPSSSYTPSSSASSSSSSSPDFSGLWAILIIIGILIGIGSLGDIMKMFNSPTRNESYTPPTRSYSPPANLVPPEQIRTEPAPSIPKEPEQFFTFGSTIEEVKKVQGEPTRPTFWYENADTTYLSYGNDGSARVWFFQGRVSRWTSYPRSPLKARIIPSGPVDEALQYFTVGSTMDEVLFVQGQPFSISISEITWPNRTKAEEESGAPTIKTSWEYGFKSKVLFRNGKVTHWEQDDEILCWKSTGPIVLKVNPQ